jgi:hypothetical protein
MHNQNHEINAQPYVAQLNGRFLTRCLITYRQLHAMRELFQRRAQMRHVKVATHQVDDALWVLLETGVLLPPFEDKTNRTLSQGRARTGKSCASRHQHIVH